MRTASCRLVHVLACTLVLSALALVSATPPVPLRVCPSPSPLPPSQQPQLYPSLSVAPVQNDDSDGAFLPRRAEFDVHTPLDGIAYRSFWPTTLNSVFLASWSSNGTVEANSTEHDTLAWRVYGEMGTSGGVTPASASGAWFSNASSLRFDYSPLGFVSGNTAAGAPDVVQTVSVQGVFEFRDVDGDGRFDAATDQVLSAQDLSALSWDTPCTADGGGAPTSVPSPQANTLAFTNLMYNPSSALRATVVVQQVGLGLGLGAAANGSILESQGGMGAEGLLLSPRNLLLTFTLEHYPFTAEDSLLAFNVTYLAARSGSPSQLPLDVLPASLDLTGAHGLDGSDHPSANFSTPQGLAVANALKTQARDRSLGRRADSYLVWSAPRYTNSSDGSSSPKVTLQTSELRRIDLAAVQGEAARMFLSDPSAVALASGAVVHNFIVSFSRSDDAAAATASAPARSSPAVLSFSLGFGEVLLPPEGAAPPDDDDSGSSSNKALIIGLSVGAGVVVLILVMCCVYRAKGGENTAAGTRSSAYAEADAAGEYSILESEETAARRKILEREAATRNAAAISYAKQQRLQASQQASQQPDPAFRRSPSPYSPAMNSHTQRIMEADTHAVATVSSSTGQAAYSPPSRA